MGGQRHAQAALPPRKTRYPLYRRLGGPQGRSGRVWKISPPPGFDLRNVQPIASRYTYWAPPNIILWDTIFSFEPVWQLHADRNWQAHKGDHSVAQCATDGLLCSSRRAVLEFPDSGVANGPSFLGYDGRFGTQFTPFRRHYVLYNLWTTTYPTWRCTCQDIWILTWR